MESRLLTEKEIEDEIIKRYPCYDKEDDAHILELEKTISEIQDARTTFAILESWDKLISSWWKELEGKGSRTTRQLLESMSNHLGDLQESCPLLVETLAIQQEALDFAWRMAKACDEIKSSHVFFILQRAYKDHPDAEDWEWSNYQDLLSRVVACAQLKTELGRENESLNELAGDNSQSNSPDNGLA